MRSVQDPLPQLNASTVYRTLDVLVEEGLATRTDLGTGRGVFEPAHEHPHHHLVCESCGMVAHVHDDLLGGLVGRLAEQRAFHLGGRELTFFGVCALSDGQRERSTISDHSQDRPAARARSRTSTTTTIRQHEHDHTHADGTTHSHEHVHAEGDEQDHEHQHGEEKKAGFFARLFGR